MADRPPEEAAETRDSSCRNIREQREEEAEIPDTNLEERMLEEGMPEGHMLPQEERTAP